MSQQHPAGSGAISIARCVTVISLPTSFANYRRVGFVMDSPRYQRQFTTLYQRDIAPFAERVAHACLRHRLSDSVSQYGWLLADNSRVSNYPMGRSVSRLFSIIRTPAPWSRSLTYSLASWLRSSGVAVWRTAKRNLSRSPGICATAACVFPSGLCISRVSTRTSVTLAVSFRSHQ